MQDSQMRDAPFTPVTLTCVKAPLCFYQKTDNNEHLSQRSNLSLANVHLLILDSPPPIAVGSVLTPLSLRMIGQSMF